jgi:hypothetical protein
VRVRDDHQLVHPRPLDQLGHARAHGLRRADDLAREPVVDEAALLGV